MGERPSLVRICRDLMLFISAGRVLTVKITNVFFSALPVLSFPSGVRSEPEGEGEGIEGEQLAQTPVTTSPSASSTTSFMSSSLEDTTTATTPVTDTETVPASESPGVMPLSLLRSEQMAAHIVSQLVLITSLVCHV